MIDEETIAMWERTAKKIQGDSLANLRMCVDLFKPYISDEMKAKVREQYGWTDL